MNSNSCDDDLTCKSHAVSCLANAESFALDKSAHLSRACTSAASARLCHSLRGRADDDGGGHAPFDLSKVPVATGPPIGQKAYTVFLGFLARNAWRSSRACRRSRDGV